MGADGSGGAEGAAIQFDQVDLAAPGDARACRICKRPIEGEYFEIARNLICSGCARALSGSKHGRGSLPRALLFGAGAAVLGTIAWFAIIKITDHEFGLLAIGIGLFVGTAVRRGGRSLGGWRYQTLAMVLTYVSITASYVPLVIKGMAEARAARSAASGGSDRAPAADDTGSTGALDDRPDRPPASAGAVLVAVAVIFGLAFAAPFLGGASNFMGILIIGIALYQAWKINRRVPLSGPFRLGESASPIAAAIPGGAPPPAAIP